MWGKLLVAAIGTAAAASALMGLVTGAGGAQKKQQGQELEREGVLAPGFDRWVRGGVCVGMGGWVDGCVRMCEEGRQGGVKGACLCRLSKVKFKPAVMHFSRGLQSQLLMWPPAYQAHVDTQLSIPLRWSLKEMAELVCVRGCDGGLGPRVDVCFGRWEEGLGACCCHTSLGASRPRNGACWYGAGNICLGTVKS